MNTPLFARLARFAPLAGNALLLTVAHLPGQATWTNVTPASGNPPPRFHHAMTFDRGRSVAVIFGGLPSAGGTLADTWEWSSGTWTQRTPTVSPPPTYGSLLVYDRMRNVCLMCCGWNGVAYVNDTWTWNGTTWTHLAPVSAPSGRYFPGVAYDPSTGNTLLFGGYDGSTHVNDTWSWNGSNWTQLVAGNQPGQPPARRGPGIAWDEHRNVAVMFGGYVQFGSNVPAFGDTWEWNGAWVQRSPATVPPPRAHQGMDFDSYRGRTVMHGGDDLNVNRHDTWEWNGSDWLQRVTAATPLGGTGQGLVFDPGQRRMLMHGGLTGLANATNQTWSFATGQPASFTLYGTGCGPSYVPSLACAETALPWTGSACVVQLTQVPAGKFGLLVIGLDNVTSPFGLLPFALDGLGAPGCSLRANPLTTSFLGVTPTSWSTGVLPAFATGLSLFVQAGVLDPGANALGVATSPGGHLVVGTR